MKNDDAGLNWRASAVYAMLPRFDPSGSAGYVAKAGAALVRAKALAKPSDPRYTEIQISAAMAATAHQKPDEAEAILRALFAAQPKNPMAQLQLSGFLGRIRGKRDEAIAILAAPFSGPGEVGALGLRTHSQEEERVYQLTRLQIESYEATSDPAAKQPLLSQIDANYKSLSDLIGQRDSDALLHLKAKIQEIRGDLVGAMATYQRALTVMEHADASDVDLMYQAALLDVKESQSGEAEKLFIRVAAIEPGFAPAQIALADQYLRENSPEKAQKYVDSVEKLNPGSTVAEQLRIRQLVEQKQLDRARDVYSRLPEADPVQQLDKAKSALLVGEPAEASRLAEPLHKQAPDDSTVTATLIQAYLANNQKDQAEAIVNQGIAKNPKDVWLLILRQQLDRPDRSARRCAGPAASGRDRRFHPRINRI